MKNSTKFKKIVKHTKQEIKFVKKMDRKEQSKDKMIRISGTDARIEGSAGWDRGRCPEEYKRP